MEQKQLRVGQACGEVAGVKGQGRGLWFLGATLLAVQEISVAMAPVPALPCSGSPRGAIEIDLTLLQPLSLDFIPYSAPSSSLSVPSS